MENKHIIRCSISLGFGEKQIKITIKWHWILLKIAIIKNSENTSAGKGAQKLDHSYIADGNIKLGSHYEKQLSVSHKVNNTLTIWPSNLALGYLS